MTRPWPGRWRKQDSGRPRAACGCAGERIPVRARLDLGELMDAELDALIDLMPLARELGITLVEASPERVLATLEWEPRLCTAGGILHGGALMSLADTTGALVAFLGLDDGQTTATITSTTQMFRPVTG